MIEWDEKSRFVIIRWRRGSHIINMYVVAPDAGGARSYIMEIATKINVVLDEHGFFDFPFGYGTQSGKIAAFDLLDANPLFSPDKKTSPQNLT